MNNGIFVTQSYFSASKDLEYGTHASWTTFMCFLELDSYNHNLLILSRYRKLEIQLRVKTDSLY